jgi:uncharacterized protein (TIGR02594 family)
MTTATEPAWLRAARAKLGTREAPGAANNPVIVGWATRLGTKVLGIAFNGDTVPWCGLFMAQCMSEAGIASPPIAIRAKAWATWGSNLALDKLAPGAVLVFGRVGGGHVAQYLGQDETHFHILGGNQGDAVTIMRKLKGDLIAARWPKGEPVNGRPVKMLAVGVLVSSNEA